MCQRTTFTNYDFVSIQQAGQLNRDLFTSARRTLALSAGGLPLPTNIFVWKMVKTAQCAGFYCGILGLRTSKETMTMSNQNNTPRPVHRRRSRG